MKRKGQGPLVLWLALVGIVFLGFAGVILTGVFDIVGPLYDSGKQFIIALMIPALAIGVLWGVISAT